jgi:hypothetical protein
MLSAQKYDCKFFGVDIEMKCYPRLVDVMWFTGMV